MRNFQDVALIRTRMNKNDKWNYEICTERDLELYINAKDEYEHMINSEIRKIFMESELEILHEGKVFYNKDFNDRCLEQL